MGALTIPASETHGVIYLPQQLVMKRTYRRIEPSQAACFSHSIAYYRWASSVLRNVRTSAESRGLDGNLSEKQLEEFQSWLRQRIDHELSSETNTGTGAALAFQIALLRFNELIGH